ncbi:TPA: rhodanese-like domain-containing protein, partial [Streptococcus agalactiae]|nr:rhodanese-like domain-containing protein [Streptococcus agalactiae]
YYLVCQRGGRSIRACQFLELKGYKVINVDGGTEAWRGNLEV